MGIKDVRDAFLMVAGDKLRVTMCELHTVQDGNNSQQLLIAGTDASGAPFSIDSGPFDPRSSPMEQAKTLARRQLASPANPPQPPHHHPAAAQSR